MGEHQRFTCEICTDSSLIPGKKFTNLTPPVKCSHPFCINCMIKYISSRLQDNIGDIDCPDVNCTNKLDPLACAAVVGRPLFVRWCDVLCEAVISCLDRSFCPYRDCKVLIVNECGGMVGKSSCPKCKRLFCFDCSEVWHEGYGCAPYRVRLRDENDAAFNRLVKEKNWKRCPSCRHFVERVGGCKNMSCRCGNLFCYNCGGNLLEGVCCCRYVSRLDHPPEPLPEQTPHRPEPLPEQTPHPPEPLPEQTPHLPEPLPEQTPPSTWCKLCFSMSVSACVVGGLIALFWPKRRVVKRKYS